MRYVFRIRGMMLFAHLLLLAGCASAPQLSPERERRIKELWKSYSQGAAAWEKAKEEWLALGELESKYLVNFLILEIRNNVMSPPRRDARGNLVPGWVRPVREIESLGKIAISPLQDTLRRVKDETMIPPCIEAMAGIAEAEDLEPAFRLKGDGELATYQSRLVRVLFLLYDPKALALILDILNGPFDWQVRYTAALVLGKYRGPRMGEVMEALQTAGRDGDPSVAKKAKEAWKALEAHTASSN